MEMKKKSKDQGHLIVANGGGAQHTGSGDGVDGIHRRVYAAATGHSDVENRAWGRGECGTL